MTRQLLVVKSRGSAHSNRRRVYLITDRGIKFPIRHTGHRFEWGKPAERTVEYEQIAQSQAARDQGQGSHYSPALHGRQRAEIPKAGLTFVAFGRSTWQGRCTIETVDVIEDFQAAINDNILVTPTLILVAPLPMVMVLGNLSDLPRFLRPSACREESHHE